MDHAALELPRSVVLALWLQDPATVATGAGSTVRRAVQAVQGDDEPHTVRGPGEELESDLVALLTGWADARVTAVATLPAPGDPAGTPASVGPAATAAGECTLVRVGDLTYAAVPHVEVFGSVLEPGHLVSWDVSRVDDWRTSVLGQVGTLSDAERELRKALTQATGALAALDVARWRPDAAEAIAALRTVVDPGWLLPPDLDPRRTRVLSMATRLRAIVALATADDGGAINLWQADQRSSALREVDGAARRAISAATVAEATGEGQPSSTER